MQQNGDCEVTFVERSIKANSCLDRLVSDVMLTGPPENKQGPRCQEILRASQCRTMRNACQPCPQRVVAHPENIKRRKKLQE